MMSSGGVRGERRVVRIDRTETTPFMVRMYCRVGGHHHLNEFLDDQVPADDELVIYTWRDATLKELTGLIKEVHEDSRRRDAKFSFRSLYLTPYSRGKLLSKEIGMVYNGRVTRDDEVMLADCKFQQGDILDVAIHLSSGIAAPEMMEE